MNILQKKTFQRTYKKLNHNQKKDVDNAINDIIKNPSCGGKKIGDLIGISVYKFKMVKQQTLIAYSYEDKIITLTLLALGTHENFYRDLKKS